MATLILRPMASEGTAAAVVPAGTPAEEIYKLVNEEVSDDAATYFQVKGNSSMDIANMVCLRYLLPTDTKLASVTKMTHFVSLNGNLYGNTVYPAVYSTKEKISKSADSWYWNFLSHSNDGSVFVPNIGYDYKPSSELGEEKGITEVDYELLTSSLNNNDFCVMFTTSASKDAGGFSQSYIELECEIVSGTPIYFKQNGLWAELSGTVYQKANGTWGEADVSVLSGEYPIEGVIS